MNPNKSFEKGRQLLYEQGELDKALVEFRIAEQLSEDPEIKARAKVDIGIIKSYKGQKQEAENEFLDVISDFPNKDIGYINLASLYNEQGKTSELENLLTEGVKKVEHTTCLNLFLSNLYFENRETEKAVNHLKKGVHDFKVVPGSHVVDNVISMYIENMLNNDYAEKPFNEEIGDLMYSLAKKAASNSPDNFDLWFKFADFAEGHGDYEEAISAHTKVLQLSDYRNSTDELKKSIVSNIGVARCLTRLGKNKQSLEIIYNLHESIQDFDALNYVAGIANYNLNNIEKAKQHFNKVLEFEETVTGIPMADAMSSFYKIQAYAFLGMIANQQEDYDASFEYLRKVAELKNDKKLADFADKLEQQYQKHGLKPFAYTLEPEDVNAMLDKKKNMLDIMVEKDFLN